MSDEDICRGCNRSIDSQQDRVTALGAQWHPGCLKCTSCGIPLDAKNMESFQNQPYCRSHRPSGARSVAEGVQAHQAQAKLLIDFDEESVFGKDFKEYLPNFIEQPKLLLDKDYLTDTFVKAPAKLIDKNVREQVKKRTKQVKKLFDVNYAHLHVAYFLFWTLLGGLILFISEMGNDRVNVPFIDAIFTAATALTCTGLVTVDISKFRPFSLVIICCLLQLGSGVMITITVVIIKRYYFRKRFLEDEETNTNTTALELSNSTLNTPAVPSPLEPQQSTENIIHLPPRNDTNNENDDRSSTDSRRDSSVDNRSTVSLDEDDSKDKIPEQFSIEFQEQELALRKLEYESMGKLIWIISFYIIGCYVVTMPILALYVGISEGGHEMLNTSYEGQINPVWWSIFHCISAFTNAGMSLFEDNLVRAANKRLVLIILSGLVALGNTLFPIVLRLLIWLCRRFSKNYAPYKLLLVRPRTLFTHLFPATETKLLSLVWILMTVAQFVVFVALNWNSRAVEGLTTDEMLLNGWFASVVTRHGGFNTLDLSQLQQGTLVLYVVMMYIGSYPVTYAVHQSAEPVNKEVQKEQEEENEKVEKLISGDMQPLGKTDDSDESKKKDQKKSPLIQAVSFHTQSLFYQHVVWMFFIWFLIVTIESEKIIYSNPQYIFKTIFEISSAYGNVGLSLGYPGSVCSFSGVLSWFPKLLICTVMFLGRHRGLPNSLDPAIQLYAEKKYQKPKKHKHKASKRADHTIVIGTDPSKLVDSHDTNNNPSMVELETIPETDNQFNTEHLS